MSENDKRIAESLKKLLPQLSPLDREIFMAYGEGMANKSARLTCDSAPADLPEKKNA